MRQTFTIGGFVLYARLRVFSKQKILFSCKSKGLAKAYLELIKEIDKTALEIQNAFRDAYVKTTINSSVAADVFGKTKEQQGCNK